MGEPLSIASGVAGIVTLGLTVCSGLDTYFSAIKNRKEDIKQASQVLTLLRSHIGLIESNASTLNSRYAGATEAVVKVLDLCQGQLQDLDEVIKKVSRVDGCSDMARALRKSKSIISYPFNRKMLVQVQDQLLKTTGVLGTCVQTLILNIDVGVSQDLEAFRNAVNDSALVTNGFLSRLDSEVETMGSDIGQTMAELTGLSEKVEKQKAITSSTHALIRDTSSMVANIKSGMEEIQSWHRPQLQIIESAGRDNSPRYLENTNAERQLIHDSSNMTCNCKRSRSTPTRKSLHRYKFWGGLTICRLVESREDHQPTCRFYNKFSLRTSTKTTLTYTGLRGILSWALDASMQRDQVGGFSILYRPRTYNAVKTNRAFELIGSCEWLRRINGVSDNFELLQRELERIYTAREASPFDIDEHGHNAAHSCIRAFGLDVANPTSPKHLQELFNELKMLLLFLSRVGVNIHAATNRDNSMVDFIFALGFPSLLPCVYDVLEKCDPQFDSGLDHKAVSERWDHDFLTQSGSLKRYQDIFYDRPDTTKGLGYGELFVAISERDELKLKYLIESPRFAELLSERSFVGHNVLHLCLNWTAGLRLLLEQGTTWPLMSERDSYRFTPLDYALSNSGDICQRSICLRNKSPGCGCSDAACMLLDKDCRVAVDWSCDKSLTDASPRARLLLSQHLKNRRERLREIATRHLSDSELQELGVRLEELPDRMAKEIWARLCQKGVVEGHHDGLNPNIDYGCSLDWENISSRNGIFHYLSSPQVAEMVFNLGFRSIDVANMHHATPIQYSVVEWGLFRRPFRLRFAYADWLLAKGARIDYSINSLAISAAHSLARSTARWAVEDFVIGSKGTNVPKEIVRVVSAVCHSNAQSNLPCPCSPGDLSRPLHYLFVMALRELWKFYSSHSVLKVRYRKPIPWVIYFVGLFNDVTEDLDLAYMAKSIVHVLTMEALGIPHLAWCHEADEQSEEDVQRFKEEEKWEYTLHENTDLIDKLEDLTEEFEQEFLKQNVSIGDFLWNHWHPTMRRYWEEPQPLDEERKQELRGLGVVFEESYESSCAFPDWDWDWDKD